MSTNTYTPGCWIVVNISYADDPEGKRLHQRVFGGWSGGYLDGDSWQMSSGILSFEELSDKYIFNNASGSTYVCFKTRYGIRGYAGAVLYDMTKRDEGKVSYVEAVEFKSE